MKQRRSRVRDWDEAKGDLVPYEHYRINGELVRVRIPPAECVTIIIGDGQWNIAKGWLSPQLFPIEDTDDWARRAARFLRKEMPRNRWRSSCEGPWTESRA